ncbi:MAG TPA: terminase, partial [Plasticicumulans sp.]|nr:terminase [Plasticicumulans sp.]
MRAIASLSQWEIEAAQARRGLARFAPMFVPEAVPAAHHLLLIDKLERVTAGEITRLMVFMPPGSAKS